MGGKAGASQPRGRLQPGGAWRCRRRCAAWESLLGLPIRTVPERPLRSYPILPLPGPLLASQIRPLPDVGAAQGESQQVQRGAAHSQTNEADHRDELRGRRRALSGSAHLPAVPVASYDLLSHHPSPPPAPTRVWRSLPSGRGDLEPSPPHFQPSSPSPHGEPVRGGFKRHGAHCRDSFEGTLEKA